MPLQRWVDVGDTHGDEIDPVLREKFFAWLDDFKPDIVIHGGDAWNFAALRKKASPEEKAQSVAPDFEEGAEFLRRLYKHGTERFLTRGNHDERIYNTARDAQDACVRECAERLCRDVDKLLQLHNVKVLPYDSRAGVLDVAGLRVIHGYAAGVGAARKFATVFGSCSFHHTHTLEMCPAEHWPHPAVAWGSGCLLKIDQQYNKTGLAKLRHENGWLYGFTDGWTATYFPARYQNGAIYAATDVKAY